MTDPGNPNLPPASGDPNPYGFDPATYGGTQYDEYGGGYTYPDPSVTPMPRPVSSEPIPSYRPTSYDTSTDYGDFDDTEFATLGSDLDDAAPTSTGTGRMSPGDFIARMQDKSSVVAARPKGSIAKRTTDQVPGQKYRPVDTGKLPSRGERRQGLRRDVGYSAVGAWRAAQRADQKARQPVAKANGASPGPFKRFRMRRGAEASHFWDAADTQPDAIRRHIVRTIGAIGVGVVAWAGLRHGFGLDSIPAAGQDFVRVPAKVAEGGEWVANVLSQKNMTWAEDFSYYTEQHVVGAEMALRGLVGVVLGGNLAARMAGAARRRIAAARNTPRRMQEREASNEARREQRLDDRQERTARNERTALERSNDRAEAKRAKARRREDQKTAKAARRRADQRPTPQDPSDQTYSGDF